MKILAIYRHYWPDTTPYARILRTILEHLADAGHDPVAFTAQPSYNDVRGPRRPWRESVGGVNVRRVRLLPERKRFRWLRAMNFAWFLFRAVVHAAIFRRYDLIIANSHPPILMGCALRLIRAMRGTPYIYHCQDIHPESAALAGEWRRTGLFRFLRRLDGATCRRAQHVVTLSRDMADAIALRGLTTDNVVIINNPPLLSASNRMAGDCPNSSESARKNGTVPFSGAILLDALSQESRAESQEPDDFGFRISDFGLDSGNPQSAIRNPKSPVRFLFAGNLGRFQGLDRLVEAVRLVVGSVPYQLIFMGEGSAKCDLIDQAGDLVGERIVFVPQQSVDAAVAAMRACDYGVVSLLPNVYRYAFPSKSMTYLSAGCPLLAVVEPMSELARTIVRHDLGYVAGGESVADIAAALLTATAERAKWTPGRRRAIQKTCEALYGEARMLAAWDELVPPVRISPLAVAPSRANAPTGKKPSGKRAA